MTFIAYAPGLQPLSHDFSKPSETFETFSKVVEDLGLWMYNFNYQNNECMPTPSRGSERLVDWIEYVQPQHATGGIWVGNSVGAHMMLETVSLADRKPDHLILYGPVLGAQSKIVELATKQGPQAVALLDGVINGKGQFPVPVAGGGGTVPIGRDFFADDMSIWVQAFSDERLDEMRKAGFSQPTLDLFEDSQYAVANFRPDMEGIGVTILVGEKDMYCNESDIAAFTRDVAPHATVIKMPGDHGWQEDRKDFFRAAIAPFAPKRPAANAKPSALDVPKAK